MRRERRRGLGARISIVGIPRWEIRGGAAGRIVDHATFLAPLCPGVRGQQGLIPAQEYRCYRSVPALAFLGCRRGANRAMVNHTAIAKIVPHFATSTTTATNSHPERPRLP